jgi:formamidopyrimidine-DNA glycosylase
MPEGPEVRYHTYTLRKYYREAIITSVTVIKQLRGWKVDILERFRYPVKLSEVTCKGKLMILCFENGYYLTAHHRMTGQWSRERNQYTVMILEIENKATLYYNTSRRFSVCQFLTKEELKEKLAQLGPDWLADRTRDNIPSPAELGLEEAQELTWEYFQEITQKHKRQNICSFLMRQDYSSGIGNYIKADSLYDAHISPKRKVGSLSDEELKRLYNSICSITLLAYQKKGHTIATYKGINGKPGRYVQLVYGRKKDIQGREVICTKTPDGRVTHWVPEIQV